LNLGRFPTFNLNPSSTSPFSFSLCQLFASVSLRLGGQVISILDPRSSILANSPPFALENRPRFFPQKSFDRPDGPA
jgi:hypothetical protein